MLRFKPFIQGLLILSCSFIVQADIKITEHKDNSGNSKPSLMLLKVYQPNKLNLIDEHWVWSEKLDGVRAYWNGSKLLTRSGNIIYAPSWFLQELPNFPLDGELWLGRAQFQDTVSIVLRHNPDHRWQQISYQVFEVPNAPGNLFERLNKINAFLKQNPSQFIKVCEQKKLVSEQELTKNLNLIIENGGEGIVVRRADLAYQTGRLNSALKVKVFNDDECEVIGYTEGKGKYLGKVGSLRCQLSNGVVIKLGSGLTDLQRANPPKIGSKVTFKFMGLTKKGLPRHPVFLRVRNDDTITQLPAK